MLVRNNRATRQLLPLLVALFLAVVSGAFTVLADLPPLIPRDTIFGNPERISPRISPDGRRLAWLAPDKKNVLQVWVKTVGKDDERIVTADKKRGIRQYLWAWNNKDLLYLQDNDGDENFHIYASNLESGETRDLTPIFGVRAFVLDLEPEIPDEILVSMNRRNKSLFDVWRADLETGALTLVAENPGDVGDWATDAQMKVRGASIQKPQGGGEIRVRDTETAPWRAVLSWGLGNNANALGFSKDGKTLFVESNLESDTRGLYALDVASGKATLITSDPGVDLAGTIFHPSTHVLQAVSFNRNRVRWQVLDKSIEKDFHELANVDKGDFLGIINRDLEDRTWLVGYSGDTTPARYYSWDRVAQKATFLFSARPALEKQTLAAMKPVEIRSRDGLSLPCYLSLPAGVPAKGLPMVLYVHGGPWARDEWGYNGSAQWLANRGYAVLQVNYRGSEGFGKKFKNAARKEFAGKMHDDLVDAVRWAIHEGIADPKRIAIMGGSYGGYATLVGVTFTPDLFSCGVDIVGPSNLVSLVESFPPYWGPFLADSWYPFVGNPKDEKDRKDMEARSPLFKASQIKVPLLIGQGGNDPRVTAKESEQIVGAIEKNGGKVTYVLYSDEGHGFVRPENRIDFYARAEAFLGTQLGGRTEPLSAERVPGSTAAVRVVGK